MSDAVIASDNATNARLQTRVRLADVGIAIVVCVLTALLLVPAEGVLPRAELDLCWPYTLADATARHIPFGRDLVFTFGPLSSLYTRFFVPGQQAAFTVLKLILVVAFCLATVALSRRYLRWTALALPLLIANLFLVDAFFLVLPWVIVPLAALPSRTPRRRGAMLLALAVVLAPLLLVKGTLAIPLIASIGAAALAVVRRSWT